jgi:hypothetical protein
MTMPNRENLAKKRKTQARALSTMVENLAAIAAPVARMEGIDLQAQLAEASARRAEEQRQLAERLQESVVPLFMDDDQGRPDRLGSCVLVRLDSDYYAFTAAHVLRDVGSSRLSAPSTGKGGTLLPLPPSTGWLSPTTSDNDLDVGVLALPASALGAFERRVFLTGPEIDQADQPDDTGFASSYFVLGYSASRTQVKISHERFQIEQKSFHCMTSPVDAAEYARENVSQSDHLLLDFDHKDIVVAKKRVTPPRLQGVSGGGVFRISRDTRQGPLVAIAARNLRNSRIIVGTRLKHFLSMAREMKATLPPNLFQ